MRHEGQIIKISEGRYQIRIALGKNSRGTRVYFTKTIHATLKQAKAFLQQKLRERDTGMLASRQDGLLADWMTYWLDHVASVKVRPVTLDQYRNLTTSYILPHLGQQRVGDLTRATIEEWINRLVKGSLGARTIRLAHSVLHNALDALVARGELGANAAKGIAKPRVQRAEVTPLSVEQARVFLEGIAESPYEALWAIMLTTGMRPAEAMALRWKDVANGMVTVSRSLSWTSVGPRIENPKTSAGRRRIPLNSHVIALLTDRRLLDPSAQDDDLIFATSERGPLEWRVIKRRYFKPLLKKLGLPNIRGYDLRHTCTTLLLESGVNPSAITQRLGHRSSAFLLDTYGHVLPHQQQEATERLGHLLTPPMPSDSTDKEQVKTDTTLTANDPTVTSLPSLRPRPSSRG